MGLKKGQAPTSYKQGKLKGKGFESRTKEEMREIALKGVQVRDENKRRKMSLQKCMRELLDMEVSKDDERRKKLKKLGYTDEHVTNKILLMVALFQKGTSGDVFAIKEIVEMMDKLDMCEDADSSMTSVSTININIMPISGENMCERDIKREKEEIRRAESGMPIRREKWED